MYSEVKGWYMTEEERLAYIEKHPIIPTKPTVKKDFEIYRNYHDRAKARLKEKYKD